MAEVSTAGLIPFPWSGTRALVAQIGYDTHGTPEPILQWAREQGYGPAQFEPRRFVGLYWSCFGDEVAWSDGSVSFCGGEFAPWLAYWSVLRSRRTAWLSQHNVELGSSDTQATHWLIVDRKTDRAWVAPAELAHRIVCQQRLEVQS